MSTKNLKKTIVGALLTGGVALAGLGLSAGTAVAAPNQGPGPRIDYSDVGPIVECVQCQRVLPGDGSVRVNPGPQLGSVRVAIPSIAH